MFKISKDIEKERIFFMTGAVFLAAAVLILTIMPYLINNFTANIYVSVNGVKFASCIFYLLTLLCFLFSSHYIKMQINWILITLAYYIIFQVLVKLNS